MAGQETAEYRWRAFFSDPSQWWDHRSDKTSAKYPDFKHKKTHEGLWLERKSNPKWVREEFAAIAPGALHRSPFSWNLKLARYVKDGQDEKALELFRTMQREGINPDMYTFPPVLNACTSLGALEEGRSIHAQIVDSDCESNVSVQTSLLRMYAKCGNVKDARTLFSKMPTKTVASWNAMIRAYVKCGESQKALELYGQMQTLKVKGDVFTFVGLLNACASGAALEEGRHIHTQIRQEGLEAKLFIGNSLIDMYAKSGSIADASSVFNQMPRRDVVSWNAMLAGHVRCGQGQKALELSRQMQAEQVNPDQVTFVGILNACASVEALDEGKRVHAQIILRGWESDVFIGSSLVDMYAKCGSIADAWSVFVRLSKRTIVSFNAMIGGYVKCGEAQKALELAGQMQMEQVKPDPVTFVAVLNACASAENIKEGRRVHAHIIRSDCEANVFVRNSLVDMYGKCGSIEDAWGVFRKMSTCSVVSWNTMIGALVNCGKGREAFELYEEMHRECVKPNDVTFVHVLNACASIGGLEEGKHIHAQIIQNDFEHKVFIGSSLIDMYAKCGSIEDARRVFDKMPTCDVVIWNAMILGYVKYGQGQKALDLFRQMQAEKVQPEPTTFVAVLNACASVGALKEGSHIHGLIMQSGCRANVFVGNSLIDMYAKCGSIKNALGVFDSMISRDMVSWNALLGGYAMHAHGMEALQLYEQMCEENVEINKISFVCLLSVCGHAGLVDEGFHYFETMSARYGISAGIEHYSCMVDLLGRAGRLHDAVEIIKTMPCEADVVVLKALLGACIVHGNMEIGERIARQVLELDPRNPAGYVLLSNIYASAGKWDSRANIHQMRLQRGVKIQLGCSCVEVNNEVHTFEADDQRHPQILNIQAELQRLLGQVEDAGYVPDTRFVLDDVEHQQKVQCLWHHSAKLAIAFGLISSPQGAPLLVRKDVRLCDDCHSAIKLISKVTERKIILGDSNCFHHFIDGACSCRDYW